MRSFWKFAVTVGVVGYVVACSPVRFNKVPAPDCQGSGVVCSYVCDADGKNCREQFVIERKVGDGLVDILVVDDNSGSMSTEQAQMASKFPDFIKSLGKLDYRVAITTTDVSGHAGVPNIPPRPSNGNGAFRDGALLKYGDGSVYLTRSTSGGEALFAATVQRGETKTCEDNGFKEDKCPSFDERGIYAANLVLDRNEGDFIRPTAHMAVVILSDENERSSTLAHTKGYALTDYDQPDTFISRFQQLYPNKTLSVHAIVVKPGDTACLQAQTGQSGNYNIKGFEGHTYVELAQKTSGVVGSICSSNYTTELGQIGSTIVDRVNSLPLYCRPINDDFKVTFDPQPPQTIHAIADFEQKVVTFDKSIPAGTKVTLTFECEKLKN